MNFFLIITILALLYMTLNLTIPIWIATLTGNSTILLEMQGVMGVFEQIADVILSTTATIMGVIAVVILIRNHTTKKGDKL